MRGRGRACARAGARAGADLPNDVSHDEPNVADGQRPSVSDGKVRHRGASVVGNERREAAVRDHPVLDEVNVVRDAQCRVGGTRRRVPPVIKLLG